MRTRRVAIVGAGIGGLVSALSLSARGFAVTVFESAAAPGGKMREVEIGGLKIDAGPTVLTMRWVFDEIFADAGAVLAERVDLRPLRTLARHVWGDTKPLDLFDDVDRSAEAIGDFAGRAEAAGFRDFCRRAAAIYDTLKEPFLRGSRPNPISLAARVGPSGLPDLWRISPFTSLWSALGEHFRDPRLRQLFGRYATYCGSSPFLAPATLMLVAHVEQSGVWSVEGGMNRLADALADLARERGVKFEFGRDVASVVVRDGRATGVATVDGERFDADAIVFNGDPAALAGGWLGVDVTHAVPRSCGDPDSLSAVTWSLVAATRGFPLSRHNVFFSDDYRAEFDDILRRRRLPEAPTIYVCAQDRTDDDAPGAEAERVFCLVNAPAVGPGAPIADSELESCQQTTFRRLRRLGLEIRAGEPSTVRSGPADFARRFPATGGALYGRASHGWRASFTRPGARNAPPGPVPRGGRRASGSGGPDGRVVGSAGGAERDGGPRFDVPVVPGGYAWWYVDALSDDGQNALTIIAFVGSVFSPYYAWAGRGDPLDHCAVNVALYGPGGRRWSMTERRRAAVARSRDSLTIGPSALSWDGDGLLIAVDEVSVHWPGRIRGTVRVRPTSDNARVFTLDGAGGHVWRPIAPSARAEVRLDAPNSRWNGAAYFDMNSGDEPLENAFSRWTWSRAALPDGAAILYDAERRRSGPLSLALRFDKSGSCQEIQAPGKAPLPPTFWRVARETRSEDGTAAVARDLEDTPFYSRSLVTSRLCGRDVVSVHESLALDRFASPLVRLMLPFRMPRR